MANNEGLESFKLQHMGAVKQAWGMAFAMHGRKFVAHICMEEPGMWIAHVLQQVGDVLMVFQWFSLDCAEDASDHVLCAHLAEKMEFELRQRGCC